VTGEATRDRLARLPETAGRHAILALGHRYGSVRSQSRFRACTLVWRGSAVPSKAPTPFVGRIRMTGRRRIVRAFAVRGFRRWARKVVGACDPTPVVARWRISVRPTQGTLFCVYRSRNAARVRGLVEQAAAAGLTPRLWALDVVVAELAALTVGSGGGGRSALMNRMFAAEEMTGRWIVAADDDVEFRVGNLARLLAIGDAAGLELFQPAHDSPSIASCEFVRRVPGTIARRTAFVEIGPCVVIGASASADLLPFEDRGMGWGEDYRWARAVDSAGIVAGIVDAVRIRHLDPIGAAYDAARELEKAQAMMLQHGFASPAAAQRTHDRWRVWARSPRWHRKLTSR
jgi:hypothetical protein